MISAVRTRPYKSSSSAFPELFRGPAIGRLEFRVYEDADQAAAALRRGEVDILDAPTGADAAPGLAEYTCDVFSYHYVAFNHRNTLTGRKDVRQALAYLFDSAKRAVAEELEESSEVMDGLLADFYGRLRNPFVRVYRTRGAADAVERANAALRSSDLGEGEIRLISPSDDRLGASYVARFVELAARTPFANRITVEPATRNDIVRRVTSDHAADWDLAIGVNHIQDNIARWNPGETKLRYDTDWITDYQTANSRTRNFVGFANAEYDDYSQRFLHSMTPRDIRAAAITEHHLDPAWNNRDFWEGDADVPADADAVLLAWKIQRIISEELPVFPLVMVHRSYMVRDDLLGVWNGDPIVGKPYPGGIASYWTFQRVRYA